MQMRGNNKEASKGEQSITYIVRLDAFLHELRSQ